MERSKEMIRSVRIKVGKLFHHLFRRSPELGAALLAVAIGVISGYGAVLFRLLIRFFQNLFYGPGENFLWTLVSTPWYRILLIPALGGLIIGPIIVKLARETKGHGVPEVMEAVALRGGKIRGRVGLVKILVSAICIGSGGSVGREGPIVQIGSSAGSAIGQFLRVSERMRKTLVGCGAAGGIAATFNAPIAGVMFALEVILGDFGINTFSPIVLSSVTATVIAHFYLGNQPAFSIPSYRLVSAYEIFLYALLGIAAGLVAVFFTTLLYKAEDLFENMGKIPEFIKPAIGGLIIGAIGLKFPHIFGVGYETIDLALFGKLTLTFLLFLTFLKVVATSITLGAGGSGGIFAPSLFIGAMLGGSLGEFFHHFYPAITASPGAYSLVGMGALVAGTTHAPITAILILFELTRDYTIILPLMVAAVISTVVARRLKEPSIYTLKLLRRGVNIKRGREEAILASILVKNALSGSKVVIPEDAPFTEVVGILLESPYRQLPVVDREGRLVGIVSYDLIKRFIGKGGGREKAVARDIAQTKDVPSIPEDANLLTALETFSIKDFEHIPVVESKGSRKVIGILGRRDILRTYQQALAKRSFREG